MIRFGICNELFDGWELGRTCEVVKRAGFDGIELAPFTLASRIDELSPADLRGVRQTEFTQPVEGATGVGAGSQGSNTWRAATGTGTIR